MLLAAPVSQETGDVMMMGLLGDGETTVTEYLGYFEFVVTPGSSFELTEEHLDLISAELLLPGGQIGRLASISSSRSYQAPVYVNRLAQNYPNPFNPTTTLSYSIAKRSDVTLRVYNVTGALVRTLVSEKQEPNVYRVLWDGRNNHGQEIASGVYFYRLVAGNFVETKKMVLIR